MIPTVRAIGGVFGLQRVPNPHASLPEFLKDGSILLANARSGIALLVEQLAPGRTWLPSYLCESVVNAIDRSITEVCFYEVSYDLEIDAASLLGQVQTRDLVVVVDYFGFSPDRSIFLQLKQKGAWILEDACQALLSAHVGRLADFVLYSPRKFLGLPDGGILNALNGHPIADIKLANVPSDWWIKALAVTLQRQEFDRHGGSHNWFSLFQQVEQAQPQGRFAMSQLSSVFLMYAFAYQEIAQRRRDNYMVLQQQLASVAVFPELSDAVVPLGFPIRIPNRDLVRRALIDEAIYPPVHWPVPPSVPSKFSESRRLAEDIMTLPCDQRYGAEDMRRLAICVRRACA